MTKHTPEAPGQEVLFGIVPVVSGETDPELVSHSVEFIAAAEIPTVQIDQTPRTTSDLRIITKVHEAVAKDRRRSAQTGKHSPLERDGTYLSVKPGDVLPGFGVVKRMNLSDAMRHASSLQAKHDSTR